MAIFRTYDAPPASSLFLILLTILAFSASFISRLAEIGTEPFLLENILALYVDLDLLGLFPALIYLNFFSFLFSLIWFGFLLILMRRYHSGRYPGVFVQRRLFPRIFLIPFNLALIGLLIIIWMQTDLIELSEMIWVIGTSIFMLQYYVLKMTLVPVRIVSIPFRSGRSGRRRRPSRNTTYNAPQPRLIIPNNSTYNSSTRSTPSTNASRTSPSRVTRPSRPGPSPSRPSLTRTHPHPQPSRSSPRTGVNSGVSIAPGRDISSDQTKKSKISASHLPLLLPKAKNLTEEDFRCIFCYELPVDAQKYVIICSNCHRPAHEAEFLAWKANSNICSFCNAGTSTKQVRLSGKNYQKVIQLALKNTRL